MVPVTRLPDACLTALFRQMTPKGQMIARNVCRRWSSLVSQRRSLILQIGRPLINLDEGFSIECVHLLLKLLKNENDGSLMFPPSQKLSLWNSMHFDRLSDKLLAQISSTFPTIESLILVIDNTSDSQIVHIAELLDHWRHQLNSLQLLESLESPAISAAASDRLFVAINSLTTLKHLTLNMAQLRPPQRLAVVPALAELHLVFNENSLVHQEQIVNMLIQSTPLEEGSSLPQITLTNNCDDIDNSLQVFSTLSDHIRDRVIRFGSECSQFSPFSLLSICAYFHRLTSVSIIYNSSMPLDEVFFYLSQLSQLIHLALNFEVGIPINDHKSNLCLRQLTSVQALELILAIDSPHELDQLSIHWTIPNVQVIQFEFLQFCFSDFGFDSDFPEGNLDQARDCLRHLFRPLMMRCPKLHTILHDQIWHGIEPTEVLLAL